MLGRISRDSFVRVGLPVVLIAIVMPQAKAGGVLCKVYAGPIPDNASKMVGDWKGLAGWLSQCNASSESGSLKVLGTFESDSSNKLVFKRADGSTAKTFSFSAGDNPGQVDCKPVQPAQCNGNYIKGSQLGDCAPFSCYQDSIGNHYTALMDVPHDMLRTGVLSTDVYVLSQNSYQQPWGARSALFLDGAGCESIATGANAGWMSGNGELLSYLKSLATEQASPAAVVDEDPAANDNPDAPEGAPAGGGAGGTQNGSTAGGL